MIRRLHAAISLLAAALLAACATTSSQIADNAPAGWIVMSIAREQLNYAAATISITSTEKGGFGRSLGYTNLTALGDRKSHSFGGNKSGYVIAERFPAGQYQVSDFHMEYGPAKTHFRSKEKFSLPLEVKAGEVVYLGEFVATGTTYKPVVLIPNVKNPYFLVSDQRARDMPIAVRENPALAGLPVRSVRVVDTTVTPFFRSIRLPD